MVDVLVSDHAVVRYLERVDGPHPMKENGRIDVDEIRRIILSNGRRAAFEAGAKGVRMGDVMFVSRLDERSGGAIRIVTTVKPVGDVGGHKSPHPSNKKRLDFGRRSNRSLR